MEWREGRAALVTEVYGRNADDKEALAEWRDRSATTWAYPPLLPSPPREPAPGTPEAASDEGEGGAGPSR